MTAPLYYNCYIDESGDEGIGTGGSRWFVLGAIVVPAEDDLELSAVVSQIKSSLGKDDKTFTLHWRKMNHGVKRFVSQSLADVPLTLSVVAVDKEHAKISGSDFLKTKDVLYRYTARYLIERLSWLARDAGRVARLVFEHRSSLDYEEMRNYWRHLRFLVTEIHWASIEWRNFRILPRPKSRLLQAADACCGAVINALEPDRFGNIETTYAIALRGRFYRRRGNLFSYGLKFMPAVPKGEPLYGWLEQI